MNRMSLLVAEEEEKGFEQDAAIKIKTYAIGEIDEEATGGLVEARHDARAPVELYLRAPEPAQLHGGADAGQRQQALHREQSPLVVAVPAGVVQGAEAALTD